MKEQRGREREKERESVHATGKEQGLHGDVVLSSAHQEMLFRCHGIPWYAVWQGLHATGIINPLYQHEGVYDNEAPPPPPQVATTNTAAVAGQVLYDSAPGLNGFANGDCTGAPPAIATMDVYGNASVKARKQAGGRSKSSRSNPPRPASGQDVDFDMPGDVDL